MRVWQTIRTPIIGRHIHKSAYAALVLAGCYEEAGDSGRHRVQAGNVIMHEAFEAHLDRFPTFGAVVLNVPLPAQYAFRSGVGKVEDPDTIARAVERGDLETAALLLWSAELRKPEFQDWPDDWQHRWRKMRPSIFPAGAKPKEFLLGIYRAVLRGYSEFHRAPFERVLGPVWLGERFGLPVRRCQPSLLIAVLPTRPI